MTIEYRRRILCQLVLAHSGVGQIRHFTFTQSHLPDLYRECFRLETGALGLARTAARR